MKRSKEQPAIVRSKQHLSADEIERLNYLGEMSLLDNDEATTAANEVELHNLLVKAIGIRG